MLTILDNTEFPLNAPMAQLDRAADYGSAGWGFDSLWACSKFWYLSNLAY